MRYFLCNKCGNSIQFVKDGDVLLKVCVGYNSNRPSKMCGGLYTIELIPAEIVPIGTRQGHFTDKVIALRKKKSRFLCGLFKITLTPVMIQRKSAQLRTINEDIDSNLKHLS